VLGEPRARQRTAQALQVERASIFGARYALQNLSGYTVATMAEAAGKMLSDEQVAEFKEVSAAGGRVATQAPRALRCAFGAGANARALRDLVDAAL
jgi:hypothetical protein